MNVLDAIKTRKSVRAYLDHHVDDGVLTTILNATRLAPSASNLQEWRFIIVRDPEIKKKIVQIAGDQEFIGEAPVVIVACAETDEHIMRCGQACYPIDVAIALDHLTLAAVELGLGTCWIGDFDERQIKDLLGIPEGIRVVELMPLGYPVNASPREKDRLPLQFIAKYEHW
jgi:nitroreductase